MAFVAAIMAQELDYKAWQCSKLQEGKQRLYLHMDPEGKGKLGYLRWIQSRSNGNYQDVGFLLAELKICSRTRNIERGKQIHKEAVKFGHDSNIYVANALIDMFAKCGSMLDSRQIFHSLEHPTVVSWNALILGYADNGQSGTALDLFAEMNEENHVLDAVTFVAALKACTAAAVRGLECAEYMYKGKGIYSLAVQHGCNSDYVQNTLLDMYAKCGSMDDAREVFDSMRYTDVVSWTALIWGYANNGRGDFALDFFTKMRTEGPQPNSVTFVAALSACTPLAARMGWSNCKNRCKALHNLGLENSCHSDSVQNMLVCMYAKCGSLMESREVFDSMKHPGIISWTALISGYADNGEGDSALDIFTRMNNEGPGPDSVAFVSALKSCASIALNEGASRWAECRSRGRAIHSLAVENDCDSDIYVQSIVVDLYRKCGSMVEASEVFHSMKHTNVVSWTALILGYAGNGQGHLAMDLFTRMRIEGLAPDSVAFMAALKACTSFAVEGASVWAICKGRGKSIHELATNYGCNLNVYVQSTLVEMYSKCGSMVDAHQVFESMPYRNVVSWNVLILGYAEHGQGCTALALFSRMRSEGPAPDSVTFMAALKACGLVGSLEYGRGIHSEIDRGNDFDVGLVNSLVDFYAKCGSLVEATSVFDLHAERRNIITWNSLLMGFSSWGDSEAVFGLFEEMQDTGFQPDGVTFLSILACCSHLGLVEKGNECFDAMSTKYGIIPTLQHYTCMIDLCGRANKLDNAMTLLKRMPCSPDEVTWIAILSACRKWKNVELGRLAFQSWINVNGSAGYVPKGQTGIWKEL